MVKHEQDSVSKIGQTIAWRVFADNMNYPLCRSDSYIRFLYVGSNRSDVTCMNTLLRLAVYFIILYV